MAEDPLDLLPQRARWSSSPQPQDLALLPGCAAVYCLGAEDGRPVQLATTQHLRRAVAARLSPDPSASLPRADLTGLVRRVAWREVAHPFEARWRHYELARRMYPADYRERIGFGPAWFLHVAWDATIPEIAVTERVWRLPGAFVGPWPTQRLAQQALEDLWDLFDLCRYPEQVRRTPAGRRCAYADMGRCDAPCDGSAPITDYGARCRAAWDFACGAVGAWIDEATERMKAAASRHAYERAALLKNQIARAEQWLARTFPMVHPVERLRLLLGLPATRRKAWKLVLFREGCLIDGPLISDRRLAADLPDWLRDAVGLPPPLLDDHVRMEHTWLLAHFLAHREAQGAIIEPLADPVAHDALAAVVISRMKR